jgi:hypothetical protein
VAWSLRPAVCLCVYVCPSVCVSRYVCLSGWLRVRVWLAGSEEARQLSATEGTTKRVPQSLRIRAPPNLPRPVATLPTLLLPIRVDAPDDPMSMSMSMPMWGRGAAAHPLALTSIRGLTNRLAQDSILSTQQCQNK